MKNPSNPDNGTPNIKNEDSTDQAIQKLKELGVTDEKLKELGLKKSSSTEDQKENNSSKKEELVESKPQEKEEKLIKKPEPKETATEIKSKEDTLKKEIEEVIDKKEESEKEVIISSKIKKNGLKLKDLESTPGWDKLTDGQKILVLEQASQDVLSKVREIGEKRFQEKNKINLSWNPLKWRPSIIKKTWNNIGKSYWISKEEKQAIQDFENGNLKPNSETLNNLVSRTMDMNLNVSEKDGRAIIEFLKIDKALPKEQQEAISKFNEAANEFSKTPSIWSNEKAAKGSSGKFKNQNYEIYQKVKKLYEDSRNELIKYSTEENIKRGDNSIVARGKAMMNIAQTEGQIASLQFINTNPDAKKELDIIKYESSWKRLLDNENIWRGIYMGSGMIGKSATIGTLGILAAPLVSGVIGGARARRKAGEKIDKAFIEGRLVETSKERRVAGKDGLFDDKDAGRNLISRTLTGDNVSAKEVGAFIDADSQIDRIDKLMQKIEQSTDKLKYRDQLYSRINYIEEKHNSGLINYGTKNQIALNYELFKKLSFAKSQLNSLDFLDDEDLKKVQLKRATLLGAIMQKNYNALSKKQAEFKNNEMLRGAIVGAGFSILGRAIKYFTESGVGVVENVNEINKLDNGHFTTEITNEDVIKIPTHEAVIATADHGQGAISTLRELKRNLMVEYNDNLDNAPLSVKHILETDEHQLAEEYGMYKPNQEAESAFIKSGSYFKVDEHGNLTYHDIYKNSDIILESANDKDVSNIYEGKMSDTNAHNTIEGDKNIEEKPEVIDLEQNTENPDVQEEAPEVIDLKTPDQESDITNDINENQKIDGATTEPKTEEVKSAWDRYMPQRESYKPNYNIDGKNSWEIEDNGNTTTDHELINNQNSENLISEYGGKSVEIEHLRDLKNTVRGYESIEGEPTLREIMEKIEGKRMQAVITEDIDYTERQAMQASNQRMRDMMSAMKVNPRSGYDYYFEKKLPSGEIKILHLKFYR